MRVACVLISHLRARVELRRQPQLRGSPAVIVDRSAGKPLVADAFPEASGVVAGMTLEEATQFFIDNAYMEELPARREALRGTFDPGYLNYTLGKLMILKLRDDYRREKGAAYSLRGFHDELLSYGAPPLPLLREVMLADPGDGPL